MRVLVAEDDESTASYIKTGLEQAGHVVDVFHDGAHTMFKAIDTEYDVLVIDRMLPGMDGLSVVKGLRAGGKKTPVLFLTALSGVDDRVDGLNAGGDDYLTKPFAFSELLARVNALGRRPAMVAEDTKLVVGDLELDLLTHKAHRAGVEIELKPREFKLLEVLMRNSGKVVSKTMLLERVWDFHFDPQTNVVETHISRLRGKIDKPFDCPLLHTIRNFGYNLNVEPCEDG